jgi:NAD(P)-dependent dehydrogenase (short-subunit alcohol dehydrogenase family)
VAISHSILLYMYTQLTSPSIGFGAAKAFLDAGAIVTVISSSAQRVEEAVTRLASPNVEGAVGNVRDEEAFTQVLLEHAPVDHIVFSGVDKIIRGKLEDLVLEDAKFLFGVKFWGSLIVGKGKLMRFEPMFVM